MVLILYMEKRYKHILLNLEVFCKVATLLNFPAFWQFGGVRLIIPSTEIKSSSFQSQSNNILSYHQRFRYVVKGFVLIIFESNFDQFKTIVKSLSNPSWPVYRQLCHKYRVLMAKLWTCNLVLTRYPRSRRRTIDMNGASRK